MLEEAWAKLQRDAVADLTGEESGGEGILGAIELYESLHGDAGFVVSRATALSEMIVLGVPMEPSDRIWLVEILSRIARNPDIALALSGKSGKGTPKKHSKKLRVAIDVFHAIFEGGAESVTDAWEAVAVARNLSRDTVRKYWTEWKPTVAAIVKESLENDGEGDFDEALQVMANRNRGKN